MIFESEPDSMTKHGDKDSQSQFLYQWFGWLPPPRYLSILFFLMLALGLSALLAFEIIKQANCEMDCLHQQEPISTLVNCTHADGECRYE